MRLILIKLIVTVVFTIPFFFLFSCSDEEGGGPDIEEDEGIYINEVYSNGPGYDWIELYNSTDESKNIQNYNIYDDASSGYLLPAGTIIPAKGFIVLICDDLGTDLHLNFKLSSNGETVYLKNTSGKLIDKLAFPELKNNQSYGRFPDGSLYLAISGASSEGVSNGDTGSPVIVNVNRIPIVPAIADDVSIDAELLSSSGISYVKLFYRSEPGTYTGIEMTKSGNIYKGVIPSLNMSGTVEYYVEAMNNSGKATTRPFDAPQEPYYYLLNTDELPLLLINEFMAANASCCPDVDGEEEEFDDWIEIYNTGSVAIDLGGMYLSDNKENPFGYKIPNDMPTETIIPAGGYMIFWADSDPDQGPRHLNFKLDAEGENIGLYYIDGRTIDEHTFTFQQVDISWARKPNGSDTWESDPTPTPGEIND